MEEKNFSSDSEMEMEYENEKQTEITYYLFEERKKSKRLDKILFELEVEKFGEALKDIKSKRGRPIKSLSKLKDLIRLYATLMDIDKKLCDVKSYYLKYFD